MIGAGRGNRTPMTLRSADFESAASASSAIPALKLSWSNLPNCTAVEPSIASMASGNTSLEDLTQYRTAAARLPKYTSAQGAIHRIKPSLFTSAFRRRATQVPTEFYDIAIEDDRADTRSCQSLLRHRVGITGHIRIDRIRRPCEFSLPTNTGAALHLQV